MLFPNRINNSIKVVDRIKAVNQLISRWGDDPDQSKVIKSVLISERGSQKSLCWSDLR